MSKLLEGLDNLLMKARLEGIEAERERIIKLLDDILNECGNHSSPENVCKACSGINGVIALIKGENK